MQFGLQFEEVSEGEEAQAPPTLVQDKAPKKPRSAPAPSAAPPPAVPVTPPAAEKKPAAAAPEPAPDKPTGGGEVVRLDRFRKK